MRNQTPSQNVCREEVEQVRQILRRHLPELHRQYKVKFLWLFGSFIRGEANERSDLDVLVEFEETPSLFEFVRLQRQLSELLGVRVDLVMKSALKPHIGESILSEVVAV